MASFFALTATKKLARTLTNSGAIITPNPQQLVGWHAQYQPNVWRSMSTTSKVAAPSSATAAAVKAAPLRELDSEAHFAAENFRPQKYDGLSYDECQAIRKRHVNPALYTYYKKPLMLTQGHMQYLYDQDGKKYLDCLSGILTVSVGHCHPKVTDALVTQANTLWHSTNAYMHPKLHEYVEKLTATLPASLDTVYLVNSGSEANDLAQFMAREYTRRSDIVTFQLSYHGMVSSIMGFTNLSTWRFDQPVTGAGAVQRMITPDPYKGIWGGNKCRDSPCQPNNRTCECASGPDDCQAGKMYAQQLDLLLESSTPKGGLAGIFVESIMGVAGIMQFPKNFVKRAYDAVRARGGLCIADEVQTGFGRLGSHFWGFETHGVVPDIVTMAKGIGNGFPLAAVVTTKEVAQVMTKAYHFNTFGGNPLASAVGSAVLDVIKEENCQENSARIGTYMLQRLDAMRDKYDVIGDVRGKGLMIGIELIERGQRSGHAPTWQETLYFKPPKPLAHEVSVELFEKTKEYGLLVGKGGYKGNIYRIAPPMCINKSDADFALDVFEASLRETCYN